MMPINMVEMSENMYWLIRKASMLKLKNNFTCKVYLMVLFNWSWGLW